jgi:hypothetical protein
MIDLAPITQHLLLQTQRGQRQLATAAVLADASEPLDRQTLLERVTAALGRRCYGARAEIPCGPMGRR